MKKLFSSLSVLMLIMLFALSANAQLTGTKNIPGDYATLELAINDLNTQGVGAGGVTLNLIAGNPQIAPAGGYVIGNTGSLVLTTTSIANQVTIQGNGNTITASPALVVGNLNDGIFKLIGADWITITGFTMEENAANLITTAGTNNMTEWGVALLYVTTTDGAQHNTITSNTIDLNRTYQNTFGIYSNSTHSATAVTTSATATTANGGNSYMKATNNTITDVNNGIIVVGPTAAADMNDSINVGIGSGTGNNINNYGTTGTFSAYANVSGTVNGILVRNSKNYTVNYNTVTSSNGGVTVGTLNGIQIPAFSVAPTGAFTAQINNNTISLRSGLATGAMNGINSPSGSASTTSSISISNNDFNTWGHTVAASGAIIFIINVSTHQTQNINNNTFTNITVNTTGSVTFISNSLTMPAGGVQNVNNNSIVTAFNKTGAGGTVTFFTSNGSSVAGVIVNNNNNNFSNITVTGATTIAGWSQTDGGSPSKTIANNTFTNIAGGTSAITILSINFGENDAYGNVINNITGAGNITGLIRGASGAVNTNEIYGNTVTGLSSTGGTAIVTGISIGGAAGTINNVYKNKVYNIQGTGATPSVFGMTLASGTTLNIYNNLIGDLKAPNGSNSTTDIIRGINITSATTTSNINLSNNTVHLNATSVGANFTTTGVFHTTSATATTGALNMRGNAIVNLSTPAGLGLSIAYRRSSTTLTNYGSSDYNLLYAGTPGASNLIFYDGTNSDQTLGAYKTRVSPKDVNSVTENPTFMSTSGASNDFLRPDSTIATLMESGATNVGIVDDYRGVARYPNAGYPNNVSFPAYNPDIGAYEFGGIWMDVVGPVISYTALGTTGNTGNRTLVANIVDATGVQTGPNGPRLYYKKSTDVSYLFDAAPSVSGNDYTFTLNTTSLGGVNPGDVIQYYVAAQDLLGQMTTNPTGGSGINPPGTTPPGSPNSYNQIAAPMSGDFTVGLLLFNQITGRNIQFETRIKKVMKEVPVQTDAAPNKNNPQTEETHLFGQPYPEGKSQWIEVDQEYSVPMVDGKEYKGSLYHELTSAEKREYGLSENMMGIYTTLTAAVADVNLRGVGATDCRLLLNDATYNTGSGETFPIIIDATQQLPTATSRLIIKPNTGVTSTISGSSTSGIIVSRAPYVTFDGTSVGSTGTRNLTISNTSGATNTYVLGLFNNTAPRKADNNTIQYCNFTSGALVASTNATFGIILNAAGGDFDNCLIDNNVLKQVRLAMQIAGVAGATSDNVTVTNNIIGDETDTTQSCYFQGMLLSQVNNTTIEGNDLIGHMPGTVVFGNSATSTSNICGIAMVTGATNTKIRKNKIRHWNFAGTTQGYGAKGIAYNDATNNTGITEIINNLIFGIKGDGDVETSTQTNMGYLPLGICIQNNGNSLFRVYYNSIYMYGATLGLAFNGSSACIGVGGTMGAGTLDIRNNACRNSMTSFTTGVGETMAIWVAGAGLTSIFSNCDYNDLYDDGQFPNVGYFNGLRATMGDWRTATGTDPNSFAWDPQFTSQTNLFPLSGSINGTGFPIASVSTDYAGNSRSTSIANGPTDVGAYEITGGTTTSMVHTINADGTYNFGFGGTIVGSIIITGYSADAPFDISWIRYSGQTPPGAPGGSQYAYGYDSIWVSNGIFSATSYELRVNVPKNSFYNIADTNNIILAKTNSNGAVWQDAPGTTNDYVPGYPMGYAYATGLTSFSLFAVTSTDAPLPVELSSFTSNVDRNVVKLNWTTVEENNNAGFDIERKPVGSEVWTKLGNIAGSGNSTQPKNYTFTDNGLNTGSYNYRLKQIDFNGNFEYYNLSGEVIVGVPADFQLSQNYPNPFNPTTKINYDLPVDSRVNLRVYDMLGREVASLVNEQVTAGYYTVQLNAANLASGTYFFRLVAQGTNGKEFVMTKKMQLIK